MSIFGSIASAVAGPLVSGIFGSKSKPQTQTNSVDYAKLVRTARAAGFNPSFALANGGAAGFTTTQVSANDVNPWAQAAAAGITAVGDWFANESERELLDAQVDLTRAQAASLRSDAFGGAGTARPLPPPRGGNGRPRPRTLATTASDPVRDVSPHQDNDPQLDEENRQRFFPATHNYQGRDDPYITPDTLPYYEQVSGAPAYRGDYVVPKGGKLWRWDTSKMAPMEVMEGLTGDSASEFLAAEGLLWHDVFSPIEKPPKGGRSAALIRLDEDAATELDGSIPARPSQPYGPGNMPVRPRDKTGSLPPLRLNINPAPNPRQMIERR